MVIVTVIPTMALDQGTATVVPVTAVRGAIQRLNSRPVRFGSYLPGKRKLFGLRLTLQMHRFAEKSTPACLRARSVWEGARRLQLTQESDGGACD